MRPTRRIIIAIGSTLAVAALNAPTASAAPPAREVIPVQSDSIYTNLCAFPLRVQDQGTFIVQTFTDATGFVVRTTTTIPHYRAVLTNQATGYSMEVGAPGPEFVTFHSARIHRLVTVSGGSRHANAPVGRQDWTCLGSDPRRPKGHPTDASIA
jgi:hypothetical protein